MKIRKLFGLRGRNARDLRARLDAIGRTIAARRGAILEIRWLAMDPETGYRASVLYELPSTAPDVDGDNRATRREPASTPRNRVVVR